MEVEKQEQMMVSSFISQNLELLSDFCTVHILEELNATPMALCGRRLLTTLCRSQAYSIKEKNVTKKKVSPRQTILYSGAHLILLPYFTPFNEANTSSNQ